MLRRKPFVSVIVLVLASLIVVTYLLLDRSRRAEYPVETETGIAMGTVVSMKLYDDSTPNLTKQAMALIESLEKEISLRVDGSAVDVLNQTGKCESETVASVVCVCTPISAATDGAFDLTIGKVSALWDFGGENERLPDADEIKEALSTVDYTAVQAQPDSVSCNAGQHLDLGAVGKGLACDLVKSYLLTQSIRGGVISVGGSICAFGTRNRAGEPWRVAIRHPRRDDALLGVISLKEGCVSTSGDYEKYFEQDGKRYFHILDARTGYPAETDLCSVTVVCDNGLLSDALSTACFLFGKEASKPLLEKFDAAAIFVDRDETVSTFGSVDFTPYES